MLGDYLRVIRDVAYAESMRTATLVGLASIPVGFLWISLFGTGNGAVLLATGIVVGGLYAGRPTHPRAAGARAGVVAALPELIVQGWTNVLTIWALPWSIQLKIGVTVIVLPLLTSVAWVLFALFVVLTAAGTGWTFDRLQSVVSNTSRE